jgi:hypothetical protein
LAEHQASRAEHQGAPPGSGIAGVEADVRACPPDQQALGLVEAAQESVTKALIEVSVLQGDLERLAVLLGERDAERADMLAALTAAREVIHVHFCQAGDVGGNTACWKECREAQAAEAAARGGAS